METKFTVTLEEDPESGDLIMPFPDGLCEQLGWDIDDVLDWKDNGDGSFMLTKKEAIVEKPATQWVLVETISTFRERYMVEVPVGTDDYGNDKSLWALDTVTMNDATEFSQLHIGEQIISHRVVTKEEALVLCDKDNDYIKSWGDELKIENFFTKWEETDE